MHFVEYVSLYQYPFPLWSLLDVIWCGLVCSSRLYLGMHTVAVRQISK